jgi:hypothetical protein
MNYLTHIHAPTRTYALLALALMPQLVYAVPPPSSRPRNFAEVVAWIADFAALIVPLIISLTFVWIIWGMVKSWIIQGGSEEGVQQGKWIIITGIIGLTIMIGMWGLIYLIQDFIFF